MHTFLKNKPSSTKKSKQNQGKPKQINMGQSKKNDVRNGKGLDEYEQFKKLFSKYKQISKYTARLYNDLEKQRDSALSSSLRNLLDAEIITYHELNDAFKKYMNILLTYTQRDVNRIKELSDSEIELDTSMPGSKSMRVRYVMNDFSNANFNINLYILVMRRNYNDWGKLKKMLIEAGIDTVADIIPPFANIYKPFAKINRIQKLLKEYFDDGSNYSDVDKELLIIEYHTEFMKIMKSFFLGQADSLANTLPK